MVVNKHSHKRKLIRRHQDLRLQQYLMILKKRRRKKHERKKGTRMTADRGASLQRVELVPKMEKRRP